MHLMYVDESGDTGYPKDNGEFPHSGGPTRHFARSGIILHDKRWQAINDRLSNFKRARHLTWDAEIKATHLRSGKGVFSPWSPADRQVFLNDLLDSVGKELDISIISIAIDKSKIDRSQRERFTNPSVRSLELLLERYNTFLGQQGDKCGLVILDTCESNVDENLRYFQSYPREFSENITPRRIVEGTLFMPSHTTNLLQIADVCTNVVYRKLVRTDGNQDEYSRIQTRVWAHKVWP